jgi:hypothetical protein
MELSRLRIFTVLVWSLHLFPMGSKIHTNFFFFFFKFAPTGENIREVEFTSVEYDVSRGIAVLARTVDED